MAERHTEIALETVGMTYQTEAGPVAALTGVSLGIYKGDFISLLGPSGCGKTTLLRIIAGLLTNSEGTVSVAEMLPEQARQAGEMGMVFQSAVLYDWCTVIKNVMLPMEIKGYHRSEQKARAEAMLELVGLSDFRNSYPHELSGGMQQRVSIARALATEPHILLMDEPFSALDEFTREKLHDDLLRICHTKDMTIVFVTHNISESVYLSDRVVVMSPHPGRVSAVVDITLPHPRTPEMRSMPEYYDYIARIRASFEGV
ncbi:MAG: ABC transporter ATP-binding protein [Oscillospiraceae bacterium]|nr:ABC transporter ATP-binding protein [Oscillospiraceae bacterium]